VSEQYPTPGPDSGGIHFEQGGVLLALVGAAVGGVVGYFGFYWLVANQGMAFVALPGAGIGLCRAAFTRTYSVIAAVACGVGALGLQLYIANNFYNGGIGGTPLLGWAGIVIGTIIAAWFGLGRKRNT